MTANRYESLKLRASYAVYLAYRVHKLELWFLCQLAGYCESQGKEIVSKALFFKALTGNNKLKAKFHGYFYGLLDNGMLGTFEYIGRAGSLCIGISDLGLRALDLYAKELKRLDEHTRKKGKIWHGRKNYRSITIPRNRPKVNK